MKIWRRVACAVLLLVLGVSLCATLVAPADMQGNIARPRMHRPRASTGWAPMTSGVIALHGCSRTWLSLLLAPAAALLSTLMAAVIGGLAGYLGGIFQRAAMTVTDLFLSLPWLFLLITVPRCSR